MLFTACQTQFTEFTNINSLNPSGHPYDISILLLPFCRGGNGIREVKSPVQGHIAITETAWIHTVWFQGLCSQPLATLPLKEVGTTFDPT